MALNGTYTGLQASIADFLHRSDMTAVIPDLIALAEERIARDLRLRTQVINGTLTTTAGQQAVNLPTGWLENENITLVSGGVERQVNYVNIQHLDTKYPVGSGNGTPVVYSVEGSQILFGPVPDAVYTVGILYYKRFDPLATTPTNWLLTNYPSVYLFGALAEAQAYIVNDERVAMWEQKYRAAVSDLQTADNESQFSGSALRVRTI